jgi:hypothetical protein
MNHQQRKGKNWLGQAMPTCWRDICEQCNYAIDIDLDVVGYQMWGAFQKVDESIFHQHH